MTFWRFGWVRLAGAMLVVVGTVLAVTLGFSRGATQPSSSCDRPRDHSACRVLFIGNSYTYVNDLPMMLEELAKAGHHSVEARILAEADATLAEHAASSETVAILGSARWNVVVLQEQSQIPASERLRQTQMYPAARQLVGMVGKAGAQPMFFLTWTRRNGWPANGLVGYASMQSAVDDGYLVIAHDLHAAVAPVGYAWSAMLSEERYSDRHAGLWRLDGSHPSVRGTYLAACVFYAAIFREAPIGLSYRAGLSVEEAARLQATASKVVLGDYAKWGLR